MAWTTAGSRSGMAGYELLDQLSEQFFRPAGGYVANFSQFSSGRHFILPYISQEI
jgi:hypothetical protein